MKEMEGRTSVNAIFIGRLPVNTSDEFVEKLCACCGAVDELVRAEDFAYVMYAKEQGAQCAARILDGLVINPGGPRIIVRAEGNAEVGEATDDDGAAKERVRSLLVDDASSRSRNQYAMAASWARQRKAAQKRLATSWKSR